LCVPEASGPHKRISTSIGARAGGSKIAHFIYKYIKTGKEVKGITIKFTENSHLEFELHKKAAYNEVLIATTTNRS
jgi:hypothetical protein